jgi:two-component system LytT family response regulator
MIRTLLVDDEPLARAGLRALLAREPDVAIVGEACDGDSAMTGIREHQPDLVLLDVQMPGIDGIEVVRRLAAEPLPAIVFVTAHDRFAVQAFEVHALDYLLKPPSAERLHATLERVRGAMRAGASPAPQGLAGLLAGTDPLRRIVVRERNRYRLVADEEIDWIGAAGNYVEIHVQDRSYLVRETLSDLEQRLDARHFKRIHRSTLVQVARVRDIVADPSGDFHVHLESGTVLRMSRRYRDALLPRS